MLTTLIQEPATAPLAFTCVGQVVVVVVIPNQVCTVVEMLSARVETLGGGPAVVTGEFAAKRQPAVHVVHVVGQLAVGK